jgi:dipeptidyl aminopeptidase/acylaminoacyl peptidase
VPLVLGVDEAGYGPLLGPLVVGATLWRAPAALADADFWVHLAPGVCRTAARGEARVPVGDSKQVFDRKRGISTLERTVLAFARAAGLRWETLGDLLVALGYQGYAASTCPWYRSLGQRLPADPARSAFEGAAGRLTATMHAASLVCCGLRAEILAEDVYNRRVTQTRNKAAVLLEAVLRLLDWAGRQCGDQNLHVRVDRLGGRMNYRTWLMQAFPARHVHVLAETEACSRYRLASQTSDWFVEFTVDGDQRHLPIALASMLAKYVRELLMERFNAYWRALAPELQPTAGYYTDAQRFLADIEPLVARGGIPTASFVRVR